MYRRLDSRGFTLIELSIVLTIIGLIVGGVLVRQSLIGAAAVRSQISQIEKYQTAVNTFRGKYGYLPGDIPDPDASTFGLIAREPQAFMGTGCCGNGNGVIEGFYTGGSPNVTGFSQTGETTVFWRDLSAASLIDGTFNTASFYNTEYSNCTTTATTTPSISAYLPAAKLGQGSYVLVWSGGAGNGLNGNGLNYFGLGAVSNLGCWGSEVIVNNAPPSGLTVQQSYGIDKKIDDGLPQSGNVTAMFPTWSSVWAGTANFSQPYTTATPGSASSCFDNGGVTGAAQQYSVEQNGGAGVNCALSFQFQ